MVNYQEAWVKLTNTQLNKWKSAAKYKTGTIFRINTKKLWRWRVDTQIIFNNKTSN